MEAFLKIKIDIDDNISKNCSSDCTFLDTFYDECKLFDKPLCGKVDEIWFRCEECLNQEIRDEIKIKSS